MRKALFSLLCLLFFAQLHAQKASDYYYEIPEYPEVYTANTTSARMVDGLGFRYYWATEGLRAEDLQHKASESGRTSFETITHIYGLSKFI